MQQTIYLKRREKLATFLERKREFEKILRKSKKGFPSIVDTAKIMLEEIKELHKKVEDEVRQLERIRTKKDFTEQRQFSKYKINQHLEHAEVYIHIFKGYLRLMGHLEKYSQQSESSLENDIKGLPWNVYF